jgi:2-methylcitrate dehydratase PrpD
VSQTVAARLAAFTVNTDSGAIPAQARASARLHLLDTLGCGIAAVSLSAGEPPTVLARAQGGNPEASLLGDSTLVPAAVAALANGTRCHALDFDDTHELGICHASTVVAPAALAVGEACARGGDDVLAAYLIGNEVAVRIATELADALYERGFHPTSVCGSFGSTAAACRLYGLGVEATTNALGIVGSFAAGLFEYLSDGSSTKPLHAGWAAQAGVQAALLARAGAPGPATVIEGRFGLLASHGGSPAAADAIWERLGERWEATKISIKPFPACHFVHSSTWAAGELATENRLAPADLAEIIVRIPAEGEALVLEPAAAKAQPRTPYDAKFSLPFTVAHQVVRGELGLSAFAPERIADPAVLELAARVRAEPLASPPSRFAGGTRFVTASGEELDRLVAHVPGSPNNPLAEDQVVAKALANAALGLAPGDAEELVEAVASIDEAASLDRAMALARGARAERPA